MSLKIITRGKGKSAVAAAAYRAGECIRNEYDDKLHSYTKKRGIVYKEIMLPENAPPECMDRAVLWNSVESVERYKTAQLAREVELALPIELSMEQNIELVREYVKNNFVNAGMCADFCIHDTGDGNPHAHILLTMRPLEKDGRWGAKSTNIGKKKIPTVDWNEQNKAEIWREKWANDVNEFLRINGFLDKKVDHRSYERQGVEQIPTIKLGSLAHRMEKRGIRTRRGDINREIFVANNKVRQLSARIGKETETLYTTVLEDTPSASDVFGYINSWKDLNSKSQKIQHLQDMADILNFHTEYKTYDMADVATIAEKMHMESLDITKAVKKLDHRLSTLDKYFAHVDIVNAHRKIVKKHNSLPENKQVSFREQHKTELDEYKASSEYLAGVKGDYDKLPVKMWEKEREKLIAERLEYGEKYYKLFKDISVVEKIRRSAEAYIDENMPDVERPEPVRTVTMTVKTPVQKPVQNKPGVQKTPERKTSIKERLANAKIESVEYNTERRNPHKPKRNNDLDM